MPAETRIKIASSLRQGTKDLATLWAREIEPHYLKSGVSQEELVQRSKVGIEILASILEGGDISSYANFIRKLALDWIKQDGTSEELKELKTRFVELCRNRLFFVEVPGYTTDQLVEELDTFLEKELWPLAAVEYLAIYETEIGEGLKELPDINESMKNLLKLTAALGEITESADRWDELLEEIREIFPSVDAGAVLFHDDDSLILKALVGFEDFLVLKNSTILDTSLYENLLRRPGINITSSTNLDIPDRMVFYRRNISRDKIKRDYPSRVLTFQLVANDSLIGLVALYSFSDDEFFTDDELDLLGILISNLKSALSRTETIADLKGRRNDGEAILELHKKLSGLEDPQKIGSTFLSEISAHIGEIRSAIYLVDESRDELIPLASTGTLEEPGKNRLSALYTFSLERKAPIFLASLKNNPVMTGISPPSELIGPAEDGALGIIPLIAGNEIIGLWGIATPEKSNLVESRRFFLTLAGNNLAHNLKDVLAFSKIKKEHERRGREINLAASLQQYLVPRYYRGLGYEIEITLEAGGDLAGDFAFLDSPSEDKLVVAIGDVSGRGIAAGMSMMSTYGLLAELVKTTNPPGLILERLNNRLREQFDKTPSPFHDEAFVTCFLISTSPDGAIRYAKAGHLPPILYHPAKNKTEPMEIIGVPLGIFTDSIFEERETRMEPGDVLLLFTDGITEARNADDEEFGSERLQELVMRWHSYPPRIIRKMIEYTLSKFIEPGTRGDDRTWIVISREDPDWVHFELPTDDESKRGTLKNITDLLSKTSLKKQSASIAHAISESATKAHERGLSKINLRILADKKRLHVVIDDSDAEIKGFEYPGFGSKVEPSFPQSRKALGIIKMDVDFIWHNEHSRELNIYKSFHDGAPE